MTWEDSMTNLVRSSMSPNEQQDQDVADERQGTEPGARTSCNIMTKFKTVPACGDDVKKARELITPYIHNTPVMTSSYLNGLSKKNIFFKCELFQKTGSFKFRGATNSVLRLLELRKGEESPIVITDSSGNHGQALALAAKLNQLEAVIVVPSTSPQLKKDAIISHGARLIECHPSMEGRQNAIIKLIEEIGPRAEYVPSSNHPFVMAGQGTMALELLDQVPQLDAIFVPVGGGGMLAGVCLAAKSIKPSIKIYAAEPLKANDLAQSFAAKERILLDHYPDTVADGLKVNIQEHTWPIVKELISGVITVTEEEIISSMRLVWERMKLAIEPSAAVGLAAVLTKEQTAAHDNIENVGVILCGGNMDLDKIPWIHLNQDSKAPHIRNQPFCSIV